jgi:4'-phosphopantetheinyl transferase
VSPTVEVWVGRASESDARLPLGPRERAVFATLTRPKRRAEWLLGRRMAKAAVRSRFPELVAPEPEVLADEDGAPAAWRGRARLPVALSITHRAGVAAAAVGPVDLAFGCDLELLEPRSAGLVRDFFTEAERRAWAAAADRDAYANVVWSAKEATLKALHTGLRRDTRSVEVTLSSDVGDGPWRRLTVRDVETERVFPGWVHIAGARILSVVGPDRRPTLHE